MVSLPITIPDGAQLLVKEGDQVKPGQILAQVPQGEEHIINVSQLLRISPEKVDAALQVDLGDHVTAGEVIAIRKNSFGLTGARLKANITGTVTRFDADTGSIVMGNPKTAQKDVVSPIAGVIQLCHNDQIVIETKEHVVQGANGIGSTARGQLYLLTGAELDDQQKLLQAVTSVVIDKVILARSLTREVLVKLIGVGASGIIATEIDTEDLQYLQQKSLVIPIIIVSEESLPILVKQLKKEVFLDGTASTILLLV